MSFASFDFIFVFMPLTLICFWFSQRISISLALWCLGIASVIFYVYWNPRDIAIAGISVSLNYLAANTILRHGPSSKLVFIGAISANLLALGYYKYLGFVSGVFANLSSVPDFYVSGIILPLGISFFTFTQIAYLADCFARKIDARDHNWRDYFLFVTFFPHLIAGPILHHRDIIPQFQGDFRKNLNPKFQAGIALFVIGLFKKVVIADTLAKIADPIFSAADGGQVIAPLNAVLGVLAYTFQLYFDFSGYSDMAVGAALGVGMHIPFNFNSPYLATSIIEFWQRWHITLSRFLRDYLYIPLGGNRLGQRRRYINIFITMLLGGIWHGAGWNFLIWGALHGVFIVTNHLWRDFITPRLGSAIKSGTYVFAGHLVTMLCVIIGWIFFRATTIGGALSLLTSIGSTSLGSWSYTNLQIHVADILMISTAGLIAFSRPNSRQIHDWLMNDQRYYALPLGLAFGIIAAVSITFISSNSPFLYFQF
jgi:alginate O-acetyltransferase complex protein AlgI